MVAMNENVVPVSMKNQNTPMIENRIEVMIDSG